ncbi:MAG: MltA domain-containing protein, partial [Rhizobacter sp.]
MMLNVLRRRRGPALQAAILGSLLALLGACTSPPLLPEEAPPVGKPAAPEATPPPLVEGVLQRGRARWVPVRFGDLPGWDADRAAEWWPALLRGCDKPAPGWATLCAQARSATLPAFSDDAARVWLQQRLQAYRVETIDGNADGLMTGYFEPLVEAVRTPRADMRIAVYAPPPELATRKPYYTRQQLDTLPATQA